MHAVVLLTRTGLHVEQARIGVGAALVGGDEPRCMHQPDVPNCINVTQVVSVEKTGTDAWAGVAAVDDGKDYDWG